MTAPRVLLLASLLLAPSGALAAPEADAARADALFTEGQALMTAGQYAEACAKFAASQRLDPGIGTLLRLGDCFEKSGRLASAFRTFREAAAMAREAGDTREAVAISRASVLEPRVPRLAIDVPIAARVPGLEIRRDGERVAPEAFGVEVPSDAGLHVIRISEPGKPARELTVTVPASGPPVHVSVVAQPTEAPPRHVDDPKRSWLLPTGLIVGGVGVAGLAAASFLGLSAKRTYDDTAERCVGGCDDGAFDDRREARARANVATWVAIGGVALVATGITLVVWPAPSSSTHGLRVTPTIGGVALGGAF